MSTTRAFPRISIAPPTCSPKPVFGTGPLGTITVLEPDFLPAPVGVGLRRQLAEIGVDVRLERVPMHEHERAVQERRYVHLNWVSWTADVPDPRGVRTTLD